MSCHFVQSKSFGPSPLIQSGRRLLRFFANRFGAILQKVTPRDAKPRISRTKGHLSKRTAFVRDIVKEVAGYVLPQHSEKRRRKSRCSRMLKLAIWLSSDLLTAKSTISRQENHRLILCSRHAASHLMSVV